MAKREPGRCKHCAATIIPGYDSCSDCTGRLEFAAEQVRNRELAFERAKAAAVEEHKQMIEQSQSLGRAAMERREREIELGIQIRDPKVDRRLAVMMRNAEGNGVRLTSSSSTPSELARKPSGERKRNRKHDGVG